MFVLLAAPCFSQTTWGGLHFGMTAEQAHVVLKDRPNKDRLVPDDLPFFIDVQDVAVGQHKGIAHIQFDKGKKLEHVSLDFGRFQSDAKVCFEGISNEEAVTRTLRLTEISEAMIERFGKPVSETGKFPSTHELASFYTIGSFRHVAPTLEGKRIWRTEGQVIEEHFDLPCGNLFLWIDYRPQKTDEL